MILLQKKPFSVIVHLGVSVRKQRQFEIIVYTPEAGHYPISGLVINCHYYNSLIKKSIHFSVFCPLLITHLSFTLICVRRNLPLPKCSLMQVPPENGVTVVFHVFLVSSLKMEEESLHIRAFGEDLGDFQINCVDMEFLRLVFKRIRQ